MSGGYGSSFLKIDSQNSAIDTKNVLPMLDNTYVVGTTALRYKEVHTNEL